MFGRASFLVLYLLGVSPEASPASTCTLSPSEWAHRVPSSVCTVRSSRIVTFQRASVPTDVVQSLRSGGVAFVGYSLLFGMTHAGIDTPAHLARARRRRPRWRRVREPDRIGIGGVERRQTSSRRTLGSAAVVLLALRLPVTDDWPGALRSLATLEAVSPTYVESATRSVANGAMAPAQIATLVETRVLGPWREHRQHIADMKRLPAREREAARRTLLYMDHRIAAWQLQADAFRHDDMALIEKSASELAAANAAAQDLVESFGPPRVASRRMVPAPREKKGRATSNARSRSHSSSNVPRCCCTTTRSREFTAQALTDAELATLIRARHSEAVGCAVAPDCRVARQRSRRSGAAEARGLHAPSRPGLASHRDGAPDSLTEMLKKAKTVRVRAVAAGSSIAWAR